MALYENINGRRTLMLNELQALVRANCPPGVVKTINLAVFVHNYIRAVENGRFLDRYDAKYEWMNAGRFVYFGIVEVGETYKLIHHDQDGLARYLRTFRGLENEYRRLEQQQEADERFRREGLGGVFVDYCKANPVACAGLGAAIISGATGGGVASSSAGSNEFPSCMANCRLRPPSEQAFCQSSCYQFVAPPLR